MTTPALGARPQAATAGRWQLEGEDGNPQAIVDADRDTLVVYRDSRGRRRYWEPIQRLANSWDALDCLGHLAKKRTVDDATLGQLLRYLDGLFEFATAFPRGVHEFDAPSRIREVARMRARAGGPQRVP